MLLFNLKFFIFLLNLVIGKELPTKVCKLGVDGLELVDDEITASSFVE